jgi:sugar transferase (PEP-CTERM/EpsH1 system associated)
MKILALCHRFPYPPSSGAKVRAFHIVSHLSAAGHDVTVASLAHSAAEAQAGHGIAPYCRRYEMARVRFPHQLGRMLARVPTLTPSTMGYFYSTGLARRIRTLLSLESFDLIYVHCSSMAQYVAGVRSAPKILDFVDMDSQKWLDYARFQGLPLAPGYWLEGKKLERAEKRLARQFDLCTTITRGEWETLESYGIGVASDWFSNGVDCEYFAPTDEPYDADTLCFVGRMDYYPNEQCMLDFCTRVLPHIRARRPRTELLIVGAAPGPRVRNLGTVPGVTVTGSVPDVRPYLRRAALTVAPLNIARGTQNKILESMALGVPVVASHAAARGVDAVPNEHLLVALNDDDYAQAILRLLEQPAERARLSDAGRKRVLSHHTWERSMRRFDEIVARCVNAWHGVPNDVAGNRRLSAEGT